MPLHAMPLQALALASIALPSRCGFAGRELLLREDMLLQALALEMHCSYEQIWICRHLLLRALLLRADLPLQALAVASIALTSRYAFAGTCSYEQICLCTSYSYFFAQTILIFQTLPNLLICTFQRGICTDRAQPCAAQT